MTESCSGDPFGHTIWIILADLGRQLGPRPEHALGDEVGPATRASHAQDGVPELEQLGEVAIDG